MSPFVDECSFLASGTTAPCLLLRLLLSLEALPWHIPIAFAHLGRPWCHILRLLVLDLFRKLVERLANIHATLGRGLKEAHVEFLGQRCSLL